MAGTRELSKQRLAAIRSAEASGSLGPFAPAPHPKDKNKLSPLGQSNASKNFADRKKQEAHFGLTRGRNAGYKGD